MAHFSWRCALVSSIVIILANSGSVQSAVWYIALFHLDSEIVAACKTMRMVGIDDAGILHNASKPRISICLRVLKDLNLRLYESSLKSDGAPFPAGTVLDLAADACRKSYNSASKGGREFSEIICLWSNPSSAQATQVVEKILRKSLQNRRTAKHIEQLPDQLFPGQLLQEVAQIPADGATFDSDNLHAMWNIWFNGGMKCYEYQRLEDQPVTWNCHFTVTWLRASGDKNQGRLGTLNVSIEPSKEQDLRIRHNGSLSVRISY
jgi:hypothetical protein